MILVVNKMDLVEDADAHRLEVPMNWNGIAQARVSALHGQGIDALKDLIVENVTGDLGRMPDHSIGPGCNSSRWPRSLSSSSNAQRPGSGTLRDVRRSK